MRVTTWTEYSLIISIHLARRQTQALGPVAARDLAMAEQLPVDYVEQILLRLRRAGVVESVRGARGGYYLAREPGEISMQDIMAASEHQTFEMNCETHQVAPERCSPAASCSIRPVWFALQQRVNALLGSVTLSDLMQSEAQVQQLVGITASTA